MKRICSFSIIQVIIFLLISALNSSCDKEVDPKLLPVLTANEVIKNYYQLIDKSLYTKIAVERQTLQNKILFEIDNKILSNTLIK